LPAELQQLHYSLAVDSDAGTIWWEAEASLARYFRFYCDQRIHQALDYRTPAEVYRRGRNGR